MTPRAERLAEHNGRTCWGPWFRGALDGWKCPHAHQTATLAIQCASDEAARLVKGTAA